MQGKMKNGFNLTLFLVIFFMALQASGQKRTFIRTADEAFEDQRYSIAAEKYQKAYTKVKKDPAERDRITFRLAECYRLTGDIKRADVQYKRLIKNGYDSKEPIILLRYADAQKAEVPAAIQPEIETLLQFYITYLLERGLNTPGFLREVKTNRMV